MIPSFVRFCAALLCAGMVLSVAQPSRGADKVFTIPVMLPLTGVGGEYGAGDKIAVEMAVDEINARGGIDGYKLAYQVYDDGSQPTQAATIMHGLVKDNLVILGSTLSGTCKASFPIANAAGVPTVGIESDAAITASNRPWTFNVFLVTQGVAKSAATKWLAITHAKNVVAIVDKDAAAATIQAAALLQALGNSGVKVSRRIDVSEQQATYTAEADAAKALNPDGLVISAYPDAAGAIVKALRGAGMNQPILFTTTTVTTDSLKIAGPAMTNGWVSLAAWPGTGGPKKLAFDKNFMKRSKGLPPEPTASYRYDAVYLVANALKASGVLTSSKSLEEKRTALREAIAHGHVDGASGDWSMNPDGLRSGAGLWAAVKDGKVVILSK